MSVASVRVYEFTARIVCPECGQERETSAGQGRRAFSGCSDLRCEGCRFGVQPRGAVDDEDRRFWLERFSDDEVVGLAWALAGAHGSVEIVAVGGGGSVSPLAGTHSQRGSGVTSRARGVRGPVDNEVASCAESHPCG